MDGVLDPEPLEPLEPGVLAVPWSRMHCWSAVPLNPAHWEPEDVPPAELLSLALPGLDMPLGDEGLVPDALLPDPLLPEELAPEALSRLEPPPIVPPPYDPPAPALLPLGLSLPAP